VTSDRQPTAEEIETFVIAAHGDPAKTKAMLAADPSLLHVVWPRTGETAIEAAAHTGQREIAEFLLAAGSPLDICTAAMLGRRDEVGDFLDDDPALVNATGAHGIPLLFFVALSGRVDLADLLVERGGGEAGKDGALQGAARRGHLEMARWLLERGADAAATDFEGKTPLQRASDQNHEAMIALLREHGATA
jgi:uncharacterized protein